MLMGKINYSPEATMDCLYHHGILGQKWGDRNGPPYPLDKKNYSIKEKVLNAVSELNPHKYVTKNYTLTEEGFKKYFNEDGTYSNAYKELKEEHDKFGTEESLSKKAKLFEDVDSSISRTFTNDEKTSKAIQSHLRKEILNDDYLHKKLNRQNELDYKQDTIRKNNSNLTYDEYFDLPEVKSIIKERESIQKDLQSYSKQIAKNILNDEGYESVKISSPIGKELTSTVSDNLIYKYRIYL